MQDDLFLGNLDPRRDWGHAREYVDAQWRMLQQDVAEDFVIATGKQHSVRDFVMAAATCLGMAIEWRGSGSEEIGVDRRTSNTIVRIDPRYFREDSYHKGCYATAWLDTCTHQRLLDAGLFVRILKERQGLKVACVEEISWCMGFIDAAQVERLAQPLKKSGYGE